MDKRREEENADSNFVSTKHHFCTSRCPEDDIMQMFDRKTMFKAQLFLFGRSTFFQ